VKLRQKHVKPPKKHVNLPIKHVEKWGEIVKKGLKNWKNPANKKTKK